MNQEKSVLSVSELNNAVARLLEQEFSWVWVEGEISNLAAPASGHIYFSLKDAGAQVRCAMFRGRNRSLKFSPENGSQVLVRCKVSLYEVRGEYQLIVDRMEQAGSGALQRKFEELKQKLAAEGLFSEGHKQDIPAIPACIGVITSRTGAAIHDVLSVISRRFPSAAVKLFPVPVQGAEAAPAICHALQLVEQHGICDVLLLVRGGGSLEDLWSFNEESVARAIYNCTVPIVSGVGHEVDVTIADFVADFRAATPTAAAETVTPDQQTWMQTLDWYANRLQQLMNDKVVRQLERLSWLRTRLAQQHPLATLQRMSQTLGNLCQRMLLSINHRIQSSSSHTQQLRLRLLSTSPVFAIQKYRNTIEQLLRQLQFHMQALLNERKAGFASLATTLNAISPLQTLNRGYSITSTANGNTITNAGSVSETDRIMTRLHQGRLVSRVEKVIKDNDT